MANWVAKTANLLTSYGSPDRVGLLLPLHWQPVCLALGALVSGATVSTAGDCPVVFASVDRVDEAFDAGADEVFACSLTPFATRLASVPGLALDAALEIPVHGDSYRRSRPLPPYEVVDVDVSAVDRVLVTALDLPVLLGVLRAGAALVLLRSGDVEAAVAAESVTRVL